MTITELMAPQALRLYPQLPVNNGTYCRDKVLVHREKAWSPSWFDQAHYLPIFPAAERWEGNELDRISWGFMPFHDGPRLCLGSKCHSTRYRLQTLVTKKSLQRNSPWQRHHMALCAFFKPFQTSDCHLRSLESISDTKNNRWPLWFPARRDEVPRLVVGRSVRPCNLRRACMAQAEELSRRWRCWSGGADDDDELGWCASLSTGGEGRETERETYFTPARLGCGHIAAQRQHVAPSTRRLTSGLSWPFYLCYNRYCKWAYLCPESMCKWSTILSLLTPVCRLLSLRQIDPNPYNAGGTALLQVAHFAKTATPSGVPSTFSGASCFCRFLHHRCSLCSHAFMQLKGWSCACFCLHTQYVSVSSCPNLLWYALKCPGLDLAAIGTLGPLFSVSVREGTLPAK